MIGGVIKENRVRKGWTQEQLSEKLCVTKATVSKWELSQSMPDIGMLPRIGDIFGISMDELLEYRTKNREPEKITYRATLPESTFRFDKVYRRTVQTHGKVSILNFGPLNLQQNGSCDGWNLNVNTDFDDPEILKLIQALTLEDEYHDIMEYHASEGISTACWHLWVTRDEIIRFQPGDKSGIKKATQKLIEKGILTEEDLY